MKADVATRKLAKEKLPAIAEVFISGPWTQGASRFLDYLIKLVEEGIDERCTVNLWSKKPRSYTQN